MQVTNDQNVFVIRPGDLEKIQLRVRNGQNVQMINEDAPQAGGPDQKQTIGAGNGSTIPVGSTVPPTGGGPGEKVDDAHRKWHSVGDPHIKMGNEFFDNQHRGDFVILQSQDKSYQVQARQEAPAGAPDVTVNTAVAIKDNDNVVSYDAKTKKLLVNGAEWDGKTQPAGGTKIEKAGDGYKVTSSKGDVTNIHDKGVYLDLDGELGPDRATTEVRGAHGVFDNTDGTESHIKRDGTKAANRDEMIEDWKVKPEEDLFKAQGKGGPGEPGKLDDATKKALTEIFEQLTALTKTLGDLLAKLGIKPGGVEPQPQPLDGKGGPAPAANKDAAAAPAKTFEDQKKDDAAKAAAAGKPADGKGGPAAAGAAGGDIWAQLATALKGLLELLTKLLAQLQGGAPPAPAAPAAQKKAA